MDRKIVSLAAAATLLLLSISARAADRGATPPARGAASPVRAAAGAVADKPTSPSAAAALPVWKSDPKLADQLGAEDTVSGYAFKIPGKYTAEELPQVPGLPADVIVRGWAGPLQDSGARPILTMTLMPIPPNAPPNLDAKMLLPQTTAQLKSMLRDWKEEPQESGTLDGIEFVKVRWSAAIPSSPFPARGFNYVGKDANRFVIVSFQDAGNDDAHRDMVEAAVRTLHKVAPKSATASGDKATTATK